MDYCAIFSLAIQIPARLISAPARLENACGGGVMMSLMSDEREEEMLSCCPIIFIISLGRKSIVIICYCVIGSGVVVRRRLS